MKKWSELLPRFRQFDRTLIKSFAPIAVAMATFMSVALCFCNLSNMTARIVGALVIAIIFAGAFVYFWARVSLRKELALKIGGICVCIKEGDIWKSSNLKVLAWNEYFDTIVDNKIVAENSLHGRYLMAHKSEISSIDAEITSDPVLKKRIRKTNVSRLSGGKNVSYKLGSIFVKGDFAMVAFSRFDKFDRANLTTAEYIESLLSFWKELDRVYAGRDVDVPLMGAGITRFVDSEGESLSEQSLLTLLLWTLKMSRCGIKRKITILLTEEAMTKVDLLLLKEAVSLWSK